MPHFVRCSHGYQPLDSADPVLAAIAPLGLGAVAGTALVVDADPNGPPYPGSGSLAALVEAGPRRSDLSPTQAGMAVLRNGGVGLDEAAEVLAALAAGWPRVVVRHASSEPPVGHSVAVVADLPGALARRVNGPTVIQRCARTSSSMDGDVQLPRPSTRLVRKPAGGSPARSLSLDPSVETGVGDGRMSAIQRIVTKLLEADVSLEPDALLTAARRVVDEAPLESDDVAVAAVDAILGLGPLERLLRDPLVTDVLGEWAVERVGGTKRDDVTCPRLICR